MKLRFKIGEEVFAAVNPRVTKGRVIRIVVITEEDKSTFIRYDLELGHCRIYGLSQRNVFLTRYAAEKRLKLRKKVGLGKTW